MDDNRFDRLTRFVPATPTRRGLAQVVAGLTVTGGLGSLHLLGPATVKAKKEHNQNKYKQKKCKGNTKECNGDCITKTHCCGGCGYCSGLKCCHGRCANCCSGDDCESGICVHGVCLAVVGDQCPPALGGFTREKGGWGCAYTGATHPCDDDDDCPFGSICLTSNVCSTPCPLPG